MLCVVVLNYNDYKTTKNFVLSILNYKIIDKIIVVDNKSLDDSYEKLKELKNDKVDVIISDKNGGYGYGNNFGIRYANMKYSPDYIVISNPDVEVSEKTINNCLNTIKRNSNCAVVAPMMLNLDYSINYKSVWRVPTRLQYLLFSSYLLKRITNSFYYSKEELNENIIIKKVGCVAGSFLLVDAKLMSKYGMYDENIFLYCEETCLGVKLQKAKLDTIVILNDFFVHKHGVSINKSIKKISAQRKIMWKSRLYVLNKYYKSNIIFKVFYRFIAFFLQLEGKIIDMLKN